MGSWRNQREAGLVISQHRHGFAVRTEPKQGRTPDRGDCGTRFPGNDARAWRSQRLAQKNPPPSIANPAGITRKAGPGTTTSASPIASTVPPATATMRRLIGFMVVMGIL